MRGSFAAIATRPANADHECQCVRIAVRSRPSLLLAFEWVPIFLAAVIFGRMSHPELILPAIAVIVGLHFIPLAKVFNVPLYYWTGGAIVLIAVASFAIGHQDLRQAITCVGCGLSLAHVSAAAIPKD
jgi:hypothetical protein